MRQISVGNNLTPNVKTTVYTVPTGFYAVWNFLYAINHTGTNKNIDVYWFDKSANTEIVIMATYPLSSDQFVTTLDKNRQVVLEEGDEVRILAELGSQMSTVCTFDLMRKA